MGSKSISLFTAGAIKGVEIGVIIPGLIGRLLRTIYQPLNTMIDLRTLRQYIYVVIIIIIELNHAIINVLHIHICIMVVHLRHTLVMKHPCLMGVLVGVGFCWPPEKLEEQIYTNTTKIYTSTWYSEGLTCIWLGSWL